MDIQVDRPFKGSRSKTFDPKERFWYYVDRKSDDECWEWKGCKNNKGYGNIQINRHVIAAHRVSWMINFGEIPKGMYVCHTCDNPPCVNPKHLFLGTSKDNKQDSIKKCRSYFPSGEKHGQAKLNDKKVSEILNLHKAGKITMVELSKRFGVHESAISHIITNRNWKHVKRPT